VEATISRAYPAPDGRTGPPDRDTPGRLVHPGRVALLSVLLPDGQDRPTGQPPGTTARPDTRRAPPPAPGISEGPPCTPCSTTNAASSASSKRSSCCPRRSTRTSPSATPR